MVFLAVPVPLLQVHKQSRWALKMLNCFRSCHSNIQSNVLPFCRFCTQQIYRTKVTSWCLHFLMFKKEKIVVWKGEKTLTKLNWSSDMINVKGSILLVRNIQYFFIPELVDLGLSLGSSNFHKFWNVEWYFIYLFEVIGNCYTWKEKFVRFVLFLEHLDTIYFLTLFE